MLKYLKQMQYNDNQLVRQFISGDEKSFEALVEKYLKPVFNFVFQMTQDRAVAEDIAQDVFVKVWKNLSKFDEQKKFSTWIFAIAKNTTFDWLRKKKTFSFSAFENAEGENFLDFIEDENALHSEEFLKMIDAKKDVGGLLSSLSPQARTILLLHNVYGFSLVEIAEIMGHPANTTKSKYRRAIINLREKFSSNGMAQI